MVNFNFFVFNLIRILNVLTRNDSWHFFFRAFSTFESLFSTLFSVTWFRSSMSFSYSDSFSPFFYIPITVPGIREKRLLDEERDDEHIRPVHSRNRKQYEKVYSKGGNSRLDSTLLETFFFTVTSLSLKFLNLNVWKVENMFFFPRPYFLLPSSLSSPRFSSLIF